MTDQLLTELEGAIDECAADIDAIYARCAESAPGYDISSETFRAAVRTAIEKYLVNHEHGHVPTPAQIRQFINDLQINDLYLALACARGNNRATRNSGRTCQR